VADRVVARHVHTACVTTSPARVRTDEHLTAMEPVLAAVCADFGTAPVELNGEDDHVHLLVEHPPTVALSRLVNSLKGVSSRRLRQRFWLRTHRDHQWSPSYFAASCGRAPLAIIRQYVEQQRRPD
jgi:putative transposase